MTFSGRPCRCPACRRKLGSPYSPVFDDAPLRWKLRRAWKDRVSWWSWSESDQDWIEWHASPRRVWQRMLSESAFWHGLCPPVVLLVIALTAIGILAIR
jgi:hypothetical protein